MTKQIKSKGFTIVELLIVIVVIAILAAITIVAYNGIQQRAKTSAAQSASETTQKKAEAANAIASSYPTTATGFTAQKDSDLTGSGIVFVTTVPTSAPSNPSTVVYELCTTPASTNAYQIGYWDYTKSQMTYVKGGDTSTCTAYASTGAFGQTW